LRHGYRLEWLGSRRLPWVDALAVLTQQPPDTSALQRELNPDSFDRTREAQLLELLAVQVARLTQYAGNASGVKESALPTSFEDLFTKSSAAKAKTEAEILAGMAELDAFLKATTRE
jgi:hypothetical protein